MAPYSAWCAALRQPAGDGRHAGVVPGSLWSQTAPRSDAAVSGVAVPGGSVWFVGQQVFCGENRRIGLHVPTMFRPGMSRMDSFSARFAMVYRGTRNSFIHHEFPGGYEPLASIMGVTLDESSFAWSYGAARFSSPSGIREGKLLMRLERRAVVRNIAYQELEDGTWKVPLTSDRTYDVKYGEIIPFDTVLQHWKDAEGNFTELLFLKGRRKGEVRLCTNTAVKGFRRLTCNIWGVNSYAPEDLGTYVVDDRSFHQKGGGPEVLGVGAARDECGRATGGWPAGNGAGCWCRTTAGRCAVRPTASS